MCGRVASRHDAGAIASALGVNQVENKEAYQAGFNIGPGRFLPVVVQRPAVADRSTDGKDGTGAGVGSRVLRMMKWGLIPSYTKAQDSSPARSSFKMINARSEGVSRSGAFRRLLKSQRCVVVVDGFYEWQKLPGGKKQAFFIHHTGAETGTDKPSAIASATTSKPGPFLHLAALYDVWRNPTTGEELFSVSILTTASTQKFESIHTRMPVVLTPDRLSIWLDWTNHSFEECVKLLSPYRDNPLRWYKVSSYVGNVRNKGPRCLESLSVALERKRAKGIGRFFSTSTSTKTTTTAGLPTAKTKVTQDTNTCSVSGTGSVDVATTGRPASGASRKRTLDASKTKLSEQPATEPAMVKGFQPKRRKGGILNYFTKSPKKSPRK